MAAHGGDQPCKPVRPQWQVAGINHQAWLLEFTDRGKDIYPMIKRRAARLNAKARKPGTMQTFTPFSSEQRTRDEAVQAALELARAYAPDDKIVNLMTLGGIAASIGVVIEDAIVMVENIIVHLSLGQSSKEAARSAIRRNHADARIVITLRDPVGRG